MLPSHLGLAVRSDAPVGLHACLVIEYYYYDHHHHHRLAALDLLRAEQLRAYTAHLAVHGPLYPPVHAHPNAMPSQAGPAPSSVYRQAPHPSGPSSSSSSSSSSSNAKVNQRHASSRSPSLSHSAESRLSSPDMVRTPDDERRLSGLSLSERDASSSSTLPYSNNLKRKSPSAHDAINHSHPSKRVSPPRQVLPSIADLLPASQAMEQHKLHQQHQQQTQQSSRATSPRSLEHILNQDLRPLSLSNYRAQTSDVRSSSSDEDELAE